MIRLLVLIMIMLGVVQVAYSEETLIVRHIQGDSDNDTRTEYFIELLTLALEKTEANSGPFLLEEATRRIPQIRAFDLASKGKQLDVVFSMTSREREKMLHPVRVPLLKGLLGHRIFIIRKGEENRFSSVKTLADLKKLRAGQGHDWPDTKILEANGVETEKSSTYEGLFKMLEGKRFDYFPRGVNEPFDEVEARPEMGLVVESKLLIRYPAPIFFFTNKNNMALADRIHRGLLMALEDGSFDQHFFNHPSTKKIFDLADLTKRVVFDFDNPLLSSQTIEILKNKDFWYEVK